MGGSTEMAVTMRLLPGRPWEQTRLGRLLTAYKWVALNLPRTTTALGLVLLFGVAAPHAYWLIGGFPNPAYLRAYLALIVAASVFAGGLMLVGPRRRLTRAGWALGSVTALASIAMYLYAHGKGLPGVPRIVGAWDYPLGNFTMVMAAAFVALHATVLVGISVAYPDRRDWYD